MRTALADVGHIGIESPEFEGIRTAIDHYVEGMRRGDAEILKQGFHPQAIMSGYLGETLMLTPTQGLYDFVGANPAPLATGAPYHCQIKSIQVSGSTACAEIAEHGYLGYDFATHFHLLKIDGRWSIVSKLFNALPPSQGS